MTFIERLHANPQVTAVMSAEEIDAIFDYSKYLGKAPEEIDAVVDYCKRMSETDPDPDTW